MTLRIFLCFLLFVSGVARALEIKTAAQESEPKYIALSSGGTGGLCVDIMRAIERVDPKIKFVGEQQFLPFKRMEMKLESGEIDVFFGFTKNPIRLASYKFIDTPLYKVSYVMAVRKEDPISIRGFDDIRNLKSDSTIMALHGTADVDFLSSVDGLTIDSSGKSPQLMLEKLAARRGRFVYYHNLGLGRAIEKTSLQDKVRILPFSFKEEFHYAAFSQNAPPEMISAVSKALKKLKDNGQLQVIFNAYVKP